MGLLEWQAVCNVLPQGFSHKPKGDFTVAMSIIYKVY